MLDKDENNLSYVFKHKPHTAITTSLNVLILYKSSLSRRKDGTGYTFNLLIADHEGYTGECACFKCDSSSEIYGTIEVGGYYTLKLTNGGIFVPSANVDEKKNEKKKNSGSTGKKIILSVETVTFSPTDRKFKFNGVNIVNFQDLNNISELNRNGTKFNTFGVITKVGEVQTFIFDSLNLCTPRKVVFITNGIVIVAVYIHGELVFSDFAVMKLIKIGDRLIKQNINVGNII